MAKTIDADRDPISAADGVTTATAAEGLELADVMLLGKAAKRRKRKAARLRAVWVSFTGRIIAQFVGSAASIVLGMMVVHSYRAPAQLPETTAAGSGPARYEGRALRAGAPGGRHRPSIVVLPMDDYSEAADGGQLARALTESLTASVAERGSLAVLSRTSAGLLSTRRESVPAIARELGVDLVLEASLVRSLNRIRVIAQLIDGRSDEHLWAARVEREAGDTFGVQREIADEIASGVHAAVRGLLPHASATAQRTANPRRDVAHAAGDDAPTAAEPRLLALQR